MLQVRVIDDQGENHGVISIDHALEIADEAGLDLVEVSPQEKPPVCKVLDYGKYKYFPHEYAEFLIRLGKKFKLNTQQKIKAKKLYGTQKI